MEPHYHVAINIIVERDGKIMLSRRANTGWNDGKLCIPGGHVEAGETPREAAVREAREEIGLEISVDELAFLCTEVRLSPERSYISCIYTLKTNQEPENMELDKCSELIWIDPKEANKDLIENFAQIIEKAYVGDEKYLEYLQR